MKTKVTASINGEKILTVKFKGKVSLFSDSLIKILAADHCGAVPEAIELKIEPQILPK